MWQEGPASAGPFRFGTRRGRDALPRDPASHVHEAENSSCLIGRATPDRAGARPYRASGAERETTC